MAHFGYTPEQWNKMVAVGKRHLEAVAARRDATDYTTLCRVLEAEAGVRIEPHDHALPHVLGDIARRSHGEYGLVLTALVHYKGGSEAGTGFYAICQELGALRAGTLSADEKVTFQVRHTTALHDRFAGPARGT